MIALKILTIFFLYVLVTFLFDAWDHRKFWFRAIPLLVKYLFYRHVLGINITDDPEWQKGVDQLE